MISSSRSIRLSFRWARGSTSQVTGRAVAGDTGGAIRGNRIDLGFNSLGEALRFGRREITVYVLR